MIRGMVDWLASRLAQSPQDPAGWVKLLRARTVIGEQGAAKQAPNRSLPVCAGAEEEKSRIPRCSARAWGGSVEEGVLHQVKASPVKEEAE